MNPAASQDLSSLGLPAGMRPSQVIVNASPADLIAQAVCSGEGRLSATGALMVDTGKFTGRSPEDKFVVQDETTQSRIWWGDVNKPIAPERYESLLAQMSQYMNGRQLFIKDVRACASAEYSIGVRVITETAMHSLFAHNMFINLSAEELSAFKADFTVLCLPGFEADPATDGTRSSNFIILNLTERMVLIGGTGYTGEIKKSIFTVLNYLLPEKGQLSMHCSANVGTDGRSALFFGLSGTGKTTLSADPSRGLIGDDEHGWVSEGIFNFEGGCYAKVINLSPENEPQIYKAIRFGALLENTRMVPGTDQIDFANDTVTANTRVSYPLEFIDNAVIPSVAGHPENIFFLTADALGVLPPISLLNPEQAMFHFISGYTARVAGTEMGIKEPKTVFSACFGAPFLPLHPMEYARLLADKLRTHKARLWLINTGWTGGAYGTGHRISIPHTRALITAALDGALENVPYVQDPIFGFAVPTQVPGVPSEILIPRGSWADQDAYDQQARKLAEAFLKNIEKYVDAGQTDIMAGAPKVPVAATA